MLKKYYHGTTVENLERILTLGRIKCTRKNKVWSGYSEDYVYMFPVDDNLDEDNEMFRRTGEQASFAVYHYEHTKRVIIEMELDEDELTTDSDAYGAFKINRDISIDNISSIYIENMDISETIKALVATTLLLREENISNYRNNISWCEYGNHSIYYNLGVKHVKLIPLDIISDEESLCNHHMDLLEDVEDGLGYTEYNVETAFSELQIKGKEAIAITM